MVNQHRTWLGFLLSLAFHSALAAAVVVGLKSEDSANGLQAQIQDTSISMEMVMGMVVEETPPEPVKAPEPIAKEEVADPTIKPEQVKPKEPEPKKEKPKEKVKEKPKNKPKDKPKKDLAKGDREINSDAKANSLSRGNTNITTTNPNLIGNGHNSDEANAYKTALRREIERHKRYPQRAKMMRKQGIVKVGFNIGSDGSLSNFRVMEPSGIEDLDKAALNAVQSARSIGPRPQGLPSTMSVPISFKLL